MNVIRYLVCALLIAVASFNYILLNDLRDCERGSTSLKEKLDNYKRDISSLESESRRLESENKKLSLDGQKNEIDSEKITSLSKKLDVCESDNLTLLKENIRLSLDSEENKSNRKKLDESSEKLKDLDKLSKKLKDCESEKIKCGCTLLALNKEHISESSDCERLKSENTTLANKNNVLQSLVNYALEEKYGEEDLSSLEFDDKPFRFSGLMEVLKSTLEEKRKTRLISFGILMNDIPFASEELQVKIINFYIK